jgi:hypothetical protein
MVSWSRFLRDESLRNYPLARASRALAPLVKLNNCRLARAVYRPIMQSLTAALSSLGVADSDERATTNAIDVYRAHLTKLIAQVTGASPAAVHPAIQFTQSLDKGDLSLATPALRLVGQDSLELALKLQNEVLYRFALSNPS